MIIRNFTPTTVHFGGLPGAPGWVASFTSEGDIRCPVSYPSVGLVDLEHLGQGVETIGQLVEVSQHLGAVPGIPPATEGVLLLVHRLVVLAGLEQGRTDLRYPCGMVMAAGGQRYFRWMGVD